jgi:phosphatidylglycerol:prolipoprotein diacylglycerol transferase
VQVTVFGFCLVAAFAVAYLWARLRIRPHGWREAWLADLGLIALVLGLVGARVRYVWERPQEFAHLSGAPWWRAAADIDSGGMVWYGGFLLATVGCIAYARWRRMAVPALADALAPPVLAGLAIGRIGCFFNGCCYGDVCTLPWAVAGRHPTQLYETMACLILALAIAGIGRRLATPGHAACLALAGYAVWRFLNEGLRDTGPLVVREVAGIALTTSQITSVWIVIVAAGLAAWLARRPRPAP